MKAKIIQKEEIAEGTLYTKFSLDSKISFKAGQFFRLTLLNPPFTDNRGNGRFLGFINSPTQNNIIETTIRLGTSAFKRSFHEVPIGTEVEIGEVGGEMTLPENTETPLVIVTGGIGIVPYISMFRVIKEKLLPHKITLIYSNTKESWAIFLDELGSYAQSESFNLIPTMTQDKSWQGEKRRIDKEFLREKLPNLKTSLIYISGTPRFVPAIVKVVKELGVDQTKLKFEVFAGY
jgi:ferredoxin-NADP reductase